jgi:hypothetical protein
MVHGLPLRYANSYFKLTAQRTVFHPVGRTELQSDCTRVTKQAY